MTTRARILTGGAWLLHLVALHGLLAYYGPSGDASTSATADGFVATTAHVETSTDPVAAQAEATLVAADAPEAPGFAEGAPDEDVAIEAPEAPADDAAAALMLPGSRPGALDLTRLSEVGDHLIADLGNGWTGELTTDIELQHFAQKVLDRGKIPFGAVVVLDVKSGEVLAMADRYDEGHPVAPKLSRDGPSHLALRAIAPAASIFKVVTSAALLEAGIAAHRELPYHASKRKPGPEHLKDPGKGAARSDLGGALAASNNGYFARQADLLLSREDLDAVARRFGFGRLMRFGLKLEASSIQVPRNRLERARAAAGFWHSTLTPLHAAAIAAAVAGDGTLPTPRLVSRVTRPDGHTVEAPSEAPFGTATTPENAKALRKMMARTTATGTARNAWRRWPARLAHIKVGGKTGTLAKPNPATTYTWFVGFAPVDNPQVAIAVMVGNGETWWQRAPDVARDVLAWYFERAADRTQAQGEKAKEPIAHR